MQTDAYPKLTELIASWFNQDFDLEEDSVAKVMEAYRAVTPPAERDLVRSDISKFLADTPPEILEERFDAVFCPDIIPSALSGSTRAFLEELRDALEP